MATKNHCWDLNLLFDVVQRFTQTLSPKDMARSPREKQREREVLGAFLAAQKGQIENFIFVNPSDTRGFRA
jgi:hypothetical protein